MKNTTCVFDHSKLLGLMRELNITQSDLAKGVNMSESSLNLKLKGKVEFKQRDIVNIANYMGIADSAVPSYFFTQCVCKTKQKEDK